MSLDLPAELTSIAARFASVLNTNHIPTPLELPSLLKYTSHLSSMQDCLQTELESLQSRLSNLQEKHELLTAAVAPYNSFSSAFRRFPPELLQVIFVHCLPESRNPVLHASEAPLVLGRVCSRWRWIVESTPELWACLHVVPPNVSMAGNGLDPGDAGWGDAGGGVDGGEGIGNGPLTQEAHTRAVNAARFAKKREIVSRWLERSGSCPLSLSFVWFGSEGDNEMRLCASLLDLFLPLAKRWGRMEFQIPVRMFEFTGGGGKGGFAGLKPGDVPLLRHFSLTDNRSTFSEMDEPSPWPTCLAFLNSANYNGAVPQLSNLSLTFFSGGIHLPAISCSSLQGLYLESNIGFFWACEDPEMWDTLAQCVALESLTLKFPLSSSDPLPAHPFGIGNDENDPTGGERRRKRGRRRITTLPMLEKLCLDGDQSLGGGFHVTRTMAGMRCPRLKVLEVFGRTTGTPLDGEEADESSSGDISNTELQVMDETDPPLPVTSHEPMHGIVHLLTQSDHPPLQRLALESVNLVGREMLKCLRLVEDTLEELVVRDYAWRAGSGSGPVSDRGRVDGKLTAEDMLLHDLIAKHEQDINQGPWSPTSSSSIAVAEFPVFQVHTLCPNLTTLDASLSNAASQTLFCDFVESRYPHPPKGVKRLKHVSCTFTAKENAGVKKRVERLKKLGKARLDGRTDDDKAEYKEGEEEFREMGGGGEVGEPLDIQLTFHMPMPDEIVPSAWTGIEGI